MREVTADRYRELCQEILHSDKENGSPQLQAGDVIIMHGTMYATIYDSCPGCDLDGDMSWPQYAVKYMDLMCKEPEYWYPASAFSKLVSLSANRQISVAEQPKYEAKNLVMQELNLPGLIEEVIQNSIDSSVKVFGKPPEVFQDSLCVRGTPEQIEEFLKLQQGPHKIPIERCNISGDVLQQGTHKEIEDYLSDAGEDPSAAGEIVSNNILSEVGDISREMQERIVLTGLYSSDVVSLASDRLDQEDVDSLLIADINDENRERLAAAILLAVKAV